MRPDEMAQRVKVLVAKLKTYQPPEPTRQRHPTK